MVMNARLVYTGNVEDAFIASRILQLYDSEMRELPPVEAGQRIERIDGVVRTLGHYNRIVYSQLKAADVDRVVAKQVAYFLELGEGGEWKLYAHDAPPNLSVSLASYGFEPGDPETLMMPQLVPGGLGIEVAPGVDVHRVCNRGDLSAYLEVTTRAFGRSTKSIADLEPRLFSPEADMLAFVAHVDEKPAGAGRLELRPGRSFASIWGGGTDPSLRKRGVYAHSSLNVLDWREIEVIGT